MKYKKPRLPSVPDLTTIRGTFREVNKAIRVARQNFKQQCWEVSWHLKGKPFASFLKKAVEKALAKGLYAESMHPYWVAYSLISHFHRQEHPTPFYDPRHQPWSVWREKKGVLDLDEHFPRNRRLKKRRRIA